MEKGIDGLESGRITGMLQAVFNDAKMQCAEQFCLTLKYQIHDSILHLREISF